MAKSVVISQSDFKKKKKHSGVLHKLAATTTTSVKEERKHKMESATEKTKKTAEGVKK